MAISIAKSTIIENIWKTFRDRLVAQVTTAPLTATEDVTIQNYVSAYSDKMLSVSTNYPMLVISTPSINSSYFTTAKDKYTGTIDIEIYTNQAVTADKFLSKIIDAIETYRLDMRKAGITMTNLDGTDIERFDRNGIKIHMRRARYSFEYHYTKT